MDFDAKCSLVAHFSARAIDNLLCDSPLGKGHIRLNGDLPGQSGQPRVSVELDRIPAAVGLDALRTVRSGLAPGLVAAGSASGKLTYAPVAPVPEIGKPAHSAKSSAHPQVVSPLSGSIAVEGLQLTGGGLAQPLIVPKFLLESAANQPQDASQALSATVAIPAGATAPLTVSTRFALSGYQISLHGPVSIQRGRELAHLAGFANASALDALAGDPLSVDLTAEGPWSTIQSPVHSLPSQNVNLGIAATQSLGAPADTLTGTVVLRDANWKADYLANHVEISQATLHFSPDELRWDPVVFTYGPLKGTAILTQPVACTAVSACPTRFQLQFGALDSAVFQAAFLGAKAKGTLLSTLIDRFRSTATPPWPAMKGTVKAESLVLGPVTLRDFTSEVSTLPNGAELSTFDAALLGGRLHGSGTIHTAASAKDKPSYQFEGHFDKLSPPLVGHLLGQRWSRGSFDGNAKIELAGFAGSDLADSAKGSLHFEWQGGTVAPPPASIPPSLARFDRWTADAEIANGSLTLKESQVKRGPHSEPVQATVTLTDPPKVAFDAPRQPPAKR